MKLPSYGRVLATVYALASTTAFLRVQLIDRPESLAGVYLTVLIMPWSLFLLFLVGGLGIESQIFNVVFVTAAIAVNTALLWSLSRRPGEPSAVAAGDEDGDPREDAQPRP